MRAARSLQAIWQPEAVIFIGLQGSGKSSFFKERFFGSHVRINLDMLRTRHRETLLLRACIEMQQHFVVDNTNPLLAERAKYIEPARKAGFRIVGYYFWPDLTGSIRRNGRRSGRERVPTQAIVATAKRMQPPTLAEGFDQLYRVKLNQGQFVVDELTDSEP
ncbi:MAG: ATP-binding protein [Chloroflexi bacterium]|nr:ATP-binding protein [Chloroflexota bacterium]